MKSFLAILILCSFPAFATNGITLHLYGGHTLSPKSSQTTIETVGGTPAVDTDKSAGGGSFLGGADLTFQTPLFVGIAFAAEGSTFKHADSTSPDQQLAYYVIPRIEISIAMVDFWFGYAIGTMHTKITTTNIVTSNSNVSITQSRLSAPAISPRVGVDVNLGSYSIGLQTSYTEYKNTFDIAGTAQNMAVAGHVDFHRSFMATTLRFGVNFL